jgi:ABC-type amino acid transport substrate-binding protein
MPLWLCGVPLLSPREASSCAAGYIDLVRCFLVMITLATVLASFIPARARTTNFSAVTISSARELVIGTKEAPPFSVKAPDGTWQGISLDLWRRVARENDLRFRFAEESDVQDLLNGVAAGKYDQHRHSPNMAIGGGIG